MANRLGATLQHCSTVDGNIDPSPGQLRQVQRLYGMDPELYLAMARAQGGNCAICKGRDGVGKLRWKRILCVDHCHTTGRVRGLICSRCNTAIGMLRDNPAFARAVADYLERPPLAPPDPER